MMSSVACESPAPPQISLLFDLKGASDDLYAIPYPNDIRRLDDGTLDLGHLRSGQPELIQDYLDQVARNEYGGFATNAGAFFRFTGQLDTGCLPASPADSLAPGSSIVWVNIEPGSPAFGQRIPVRWRFKEAAGGFIGSNALALLPVTGFVQEPRSHYAIILTEALCDPRGRPLLVPPTMRALLASTPPSDTDPQIQRAFSLYAPLRDYLSNVNLTGVVAATVYTTGDPAGLAGRARRVLQEVAPPEAEGLVAVAETDRFYELRGYYTAPNFQKGTPPFARPRDGGGIVLDGKGDPIPQRSETLRFALTVPKGTMPASGWPVVLYAHGTGGDYETFIHEGLAGLLAAAKDIDDSPLPQLAMVSIDQNLHGPRDPSGGLPELNFFNFQNAVSSVYNMVQAGIDDFSLLRMITKLSAVQVRWSAPGRHVTLRFDPPLRFDPKRIYFMGHSQGGYTGPVFLAHEPEVRGAMLSGAGGGVMLGLLDKTAPFPVKPLLQIAINAQSGLNEEADEFHPLLNLIQQMLEPADPLNYGPMLIRHRASGVPAKHIFLSQGLIDHYTPNSTTDALAAALELPLVNPVLRPIAALDLRALKPIALPLAGNLSVDQRAITAGLVQYRAAATGEKCSDSVPCKSGECDRGVCLAEGHFVVFDDPRANQHVARFFGTMARYGVPTIGP